MPRTFSTNSVSEIIRSAEKQISAGNLQRAAALLSNARAIEPSNEYIAAILERITLVGQSGETPGSASQAPAQRPVEPPPAPDDVAGQVKRLTADARGLYHRGAYQSAFDALTNAYLLDPASVDVQQTEALILPAFERMRMQRAGTVPESGRPSASQVIRDHLATETPAGQAGTGKAQGGFFARLRKALPLR